MNDRYNELWNLDEQEGEYLNLYDGVLEADYGSDRNEWAYRPSASQAFSITVVVVTEAYNESITLVPEDEAKIIAIELLTSVAYAINGNGGNFKPRSDEWQANLWAYFARLAGGYLWEDLNVE